jgi:hypothetical protein
MGVPCEATPSTRAEMMEYWKTSFAAILRGYLVVVVLVMFLDEVILLLGGEKSCQVGLGLGGGLGLLPVRDFRNNFRSRK